MYKNKPVIISDRPLWRNPIFPWGWYSLTTDMLLLLHNEEIKAEGYYSPCDGGGGIFRSYSQEYE